MEDNEQQQLIFSGRTVEEALKTAREKLDLDPYAELNYEVLEEGKKKKFLFFGGAKETHEVRILIKFGQNKNRSQGYTETDSPGNSIKHMVEDVWHEQTSSGIYPKPRQGQAQGRQDRRPRRSTAQQNFHRQNYGQHHDHHDRRVRSSSPTGERSYPPAPPVQPEVLNTVGVELNTLFQKMGFDIKVSVETSLKNASIIRISSEGQDSGWLTGYPDMNPHSVEELITKMVKTKFGEDKSCRLYFVGRRSGGRREHGYTPRVDEAALKEQVIACLDRAKQTGVPEFLGPMNAYERRLVHTLVAQQGNYVTESIGEGPRKKIKITYQP